MHTKTWPLLLALLMTGCASAPPRPMATTDSPTPELSAKSAFEQVGVSDSVGEKGIFVESGSARPNRTGYTPKAAVSAPTHYRGISYWIEREAHSTHRRVTSSTIFSSGDRIRFHVRSNLSGYLYVVAQGTSGTNKIIYPVDAGENALIEANRHYTIPGSGAVVFDEQAGDEVLWLFISQRPLPGSNERKDQRAGSRILAVADSRYNDCGTKDLLLSPESLNGECGFKSGLGTKDLLVQDDAAGPEPAGYVVGNVDRLSQGTLLSLRLVLRHR